MNIQAKTEWHREAVVHRFDWVNDDIRLILCYNTTIPGFSTEAQVILNSEIDPASGYVAGGSVLQNRAINDGPLSIRFTSSEVVWNQVNGYTNFGAIVNFTPSEPQILGIIDFKELIFGDVSPIRIRWNNGRVLVAERG